MRYKAKPIYAKDKSSLIALKVKKDNLEKDFDGYYETIRKRLDADELKMEDYDENEVVIYDRHRFSNK